MLREALPDQHIDQQIEQHVEQPAAVSVVREEARRLAGELPGSLRRIQVRSGEVAVEIEWQDAGYPTEPQVNTNVVVTGTATAVAKVGESQSTEDERHLVVSPMVGTFYHAPEPGAPPFVKVGDTVEVGQTIGIVEAMKLMNPITADIEGTVVEIVTGNAEPVEFGQPLVAVVPS